MAQNLIIDDLSPPKSQTKEADADSTRSPGTTIVAPSTIQPDDLPISNQPSINQTYVTRKDRLGVEPAWVDCDFCKRRVQTRVTSTELPNDNEGILALLLCLVCPCLICLACMGSGEHEVSHYCTGAGCGQRLTYKRASDPIQVMKPQVSVQEASKYGVADEQVENEK